MKEMKKKLKDVQVNDVLRGGERVLATSRDRY